MGQYYKAHLMRNNKKYVLTPWDYDNGAKLMEHSWLGNRFTNAVYALIEEEPAQVAWVGDYSDNAHCDPEVFEDCWVKDIKETFLAGAQDYFHNDDSVKGHGFLINHSKKEYVDMEKYSSLARVREDDVDWIIDPLPLLTAIGNGLGGGDYYKGNQNIEMVGIWCNDNIEYDQYAHPENYFDITRDVIFIEK